MDLGVKCASSSMQRPRHRTGLYRDLLRDQRPGRDTSMIGALHFIGIFRKVVLRQRLALHRRSVRCADAFRTKPLTFAARHTSSIFSGSCSRVGIRGIGEVDCPRAAEALNARMEPCSRVFCSLPQRARVTRSGSRGGGAFGAASLCAGA